MTTGPTIDLRGLVKTAFTTALDDATPLIGEKLLDTNFQVRETYLPVTRLRDLPIGGLLWIVSLAKDDQRLTRRRSYTSEIPVQIGYQRPITDVEDIDSINTIVNLQDQLRSVARQATSDNQAFSWSRNEALRDEAGLPYNFTGLRERSVFESYFTAFYDVSIEG